MPHVDTIACPSVLYLWISSLPMGLSPSYLFWWQLMWWVTTDVAVSVCGRSGLWPFQSVAVPVCGRSGLWPFRFVAVPVCGRFGLWPFRSVAVPVCGRFGLWPFRLWPFRFVAVMTCYLYIYPSIFVLADFDKISNGIETIVADHHSNQAFFFNFLRENTVTDFDKVSEWVIKF